MRLAAHFHLVPKLRVCEAVYPLHICALLCVCHLPTDGFTKILHVTELCGELPILSGRVELHFAGLIEVASHPGM